MSDDAADDAAPGADGPRPQPRPPEAERATFRRSDFVMLRRAARERWGVPDRLQNEAIFQAAKIVTRADTGDRERLAALRFLVAADRSDVIAELAAARTRILELELELRTRAGVAAAAGTAADVGALSDEDLDLFLARHGA